MESKCLSFKVFNFVFFLQFCTKGSKYLAKTMSISQDFKHKSAKKAENKIFICHISKKVLFKLSNVCH